MVNRRAYMDDEWLKNLEVDPAVLSVLLTGSRAEGVNDPLSDFDLLLIVGDVEKVLVEGSWQNAFGRLVLFVPEALSYFGDRLATRLCLFEGGTKADFTFAPIELIEKMTLHPLPAEWSKGVRVLFDKTGKLQNIVQKGKFAQRRALPQEAEFERAVSEFWFEAYHVALYLKRGDLWQAKFRERGIYDMALLPMIVWYTLSRKGDQEIPLGGKRMQQWAPKEVLEQISAIFSGFDSEEGWHGLFALIHLFRDLAQESAKRLGYPYPHSLDQEVFFWIKNLRGRA